MAQLHDDRVIHDMELIKSQPAAGRCTSFFTRQVVPTGAVCEQFASIAVDFTLHGGKQTAFDKAASMVHIILVKF